MNMELSISGQALDFLLSCLLGVGLGALYDVFRILRLAFWHGKIIISIQDIVFFVLAAISSFLFMLFRCEGQLRFYVLLGELLGFVVYYFTVGFLVIRMSKCIINWVKKILFFLYKIFIRPFVKLFVFIFRKIKMFFMYIISKFKKLSRISKFRLQKKDVLLYNLNSSKKKSKNKKKNNKNCMKEDN